MNSNLYRMTLNSTRLFHISPCLLKKVPTSLLLQPAAAIPVPIINGRRGGKEVFNRSPSKYSNSKNSAVTSEDLNNEIATPNADPLEEEYNKLIDRTFRIPSMGHQVFVIQPYIKWGAGKKRNTTPDLQLAESCTLIKTLQQWTVVDKLTVSLMTLDKTTVFGKGNLENFQERVFQNPNISAVFVSIDILKTVQREFLENIFRVPVFDRYGIVIQIFREHAVTREAKLQVKLAELPYLWGRLSSIQPNQPYRGKSGESFSDFQRNILREKEKKIRDEIDSLKSQRSLLRKRRQKSQLPVVAVVGYTNCGKTSLIKALTNEDAILPKNVLFATLDVTAHAGILPSGLKCIYIDTIGFISDIPTGLLESFVATLEDALLADVVVHVQDVSHPDYEAQSQHVQDTLRQLNLEESLMNNIITVGNKVDLLEKEDERFSDIILTSAVKLRGLDRLEEAIEDVILRVSDRKRMQIRVPTGGEEYLWLRREATICDVQADSKNEDYSLVSVIITSQTLARFTHTFIVSKKNS